MMKKIISSIILFLFFVNGFSHSNFYFGAYYNFSAGTILSKSGSSGMEPGFGFKINNGFGLKTEHYLKEGKFGWSLGVGYMQRGAMFDADVATYTPRYRFGYADALLCVKYRTNEIVKKSRLNFSLGISESILLSADRVNSIGSVSIKQDMKTSDFGAYTSFGIDIPILEQDVLQINLNSNFGFSEIFSGVFADNNISGTNLLVGLQLNYLFGIKSK